MATQLRSLAQAALRRGVTGTLLRPQPAVAGMDSILHASPLFKFPS